MLVPVGRWVLLRVIARRKVQGHAEIVTPACEFGGMVIAPGFRPRTDGNAAGFRHHLLEVEWLEDELDAMAPHDVLQFRSAEIGPRRRERVEARQFLHGSASSAAKQVVV